MLGKHKRKGIGSELVRFVISHAREHGLKEVTLTTTEYHLAAIELYKRAGFKEVGRAQLYPFFEMVEMRLSMD